MEKHNEILRQQFFLSLIRRKTKEKYVAFERYKDNYELVVGSKRFKLEGQPSDITDEGYLKFIQNEL